MESINHKLGNLFPSDTEKFTKAFIEEYTRNAFGSLSLKEVDLLVFRLFQEIGIVKESDSLYTISRLLKIPQTRVKSFRLQNQLRDPKMDDTYTLSKLISSLETAKFTQKNQVISFGIEDQLIREALEERLKSKGETPDYSFNKDILKMSIEGLSQLIDDVLSTPSQKAKILDKLKSYEPFKTFVKSTLKETLVHLFGTLAGEGLPHLVKMLRGM